MEPRTHLFKTQADWEAWLAKNYAQVDGIWLKIAKKAGGKTSVSYNDAVESALCYGWIDGIVKRYDDQYYIQKFTPRRPKSIWSKVNVGKVEKLIVAGRMQPSGQAAVDAAKADGRWANAYSSSATMEPPAKLIAALQSNPKAQAFYATLNKSNRYAIYFAIQSAKHQETKDRRIKKFIDMLARGEKLY